MCVVLPQKATAQVSVDSLIAKAGYYYNHDQLDSSEYYYNLVYQDKNIDNQLQGLAGKIKICIFNNDFLKADSLIALGDQRIAGLPYSKAIGKYETMKAEYFKKASRFPEALALHKQTIAKTDLLEDAKLLKADALLYTALTYERMSMYDSSLQYAQLAYDLFLNESDTTEVRFGTILNSIAVCYYRANHFDKARQLYLKAKNIAESKLGPVSSDLSYTLGNLAALESDLQNYPQAIKYNEQALKINRALKHEDGIASNYYSLGVNHYYLGDYGRAKDYMEACIEIRERILHPLHARLIWPYQVLGIALQQSGDYDQNIYFNEKSRKILIANFGPESIEEGLLNENMATAYLNADQPDSALVYIQKASDILLKTLAEDDYSLGIHYFSLANIHYMTSNYKKAKSFIKESCKVYERIGASTNSDYAQNLALEALIDVYLNDYNSAEQLFTRSLAIIQKDDEFEYSANAFWIIGSYAGYLFDKYQRTGDTRTLEAYKRYASIYLEHTNKFRRQFNDPYTKSALMRNSVRIYNDQIGHYYQLYSETRDPQFLESAYSFSENGRAALLTDMLDNRIEHFTGVPDSLIAEERRLQEEITSLNQQYLEYPDSIPIKKALFEAKEALYQHTEKIKTTNAEYYHTKFISGAVPLENVKTGLAKDENIIEYMRDDTAYYAILINQDITDLFYLGNKALIDSSVMKWRQAISEQDIRKTNQTTSALYYFLWHPLHKGLNGDRITIIPNGSLFYLNFETLSPTGKPKDYLIHQYNISYGLSVRVLLMAREKEKNSKTGLAIAIAPGFEDDIKNRYKTALDSLEFVDDDFLHTVRQPWSVKLANKLKRAYRNNAFTGMAATESNIKSNLHKGNVLYFGTHAITNPKDPLRSRLVLAKEIGEQNEDGYLHAYEMYGLSLNADLAVLNACESGIGQLQDGEGMISLAYSLNFAGCPSTIMSLWKVDEKTNTRITDLFFENLAAGQTKSEALRNAKLTFLSTADETYQHPYFWSGMVLMGNDGDVRFKKKTPIALILMGLGILFLAAMTWQVLRKKGRT